MAIPFYSKSDYLKGQKALTTGINLTPAELEAYMTTEYNVKANKEERARAYALQQEAMQTQKEQFAIQTQTQREAAEGQERAATVAGVGTAISATAQAALLYKLYGGAAGAGAAGAGAAGAGAAGAGAAGAGAAGAGAAGAGAAGAGAAGAGAAGAGAASTGAAGAGAAGAGAAGAGAAGAGAAGAGAGLALTGAAALYAHQDAVTGKTKYGEQISSATPWNDTTTEGRIANVVLAPFEAAYGISTAAIDSATKGTVICTELHRQGYLTDRDLFFDRIYGMITNKHIHKGYLILARPIVEKMQKSKKFTKFIAIFGTAFAKEVGHKFNPIEYESSLLGKAIIFFGKPLCRIIYALGGK